MRFRHGLYLGLIGHLFLALLASDRQWGLPPWPVFGALTAITLATTAASLWVRVASLHVAGSIAASIVVAMWSWAAGAPEWGMTAVFATAAASAYALAWIPFGDRFGSQRIVAAGACGALFVAEYTLLLAVGGETSPPFAALLAAHVINLAIVLALTSSYGWRHVAIVAVVPAWMAVMQSQLRPDLVDVWPQLLLLAGSLYLLFVGYPFAAGTRAREERDPYLAAIAASAMAFFAGRKAFEAGGLDWMVGVIPVVEGAVLALLLRSLLRLQPSGQRDMGRLALVAGSALAFVTVAIPLQLDHQWITIGWALEGAALAWLYRPRPAPRPVLRRDGAPGRRLRPAGAQPGGPALRAARRDADPQLVSLYLRALRGGDAGRRLVAVEDRRSPAWRHPRVAAAAGGGDDPAVPAAEHRDRRLLLRPARGSRSGSARRCRRTSPTRSAG